STYLGGSNYDQGDSIAVDSSGNAYVTGCTKSSNFPTVNALYPIHGGGWYAFDAFIFKLSADGSQAVYSTYLGGAHNDYGKGISVDSSGNAYVTGFTDSPDFPTVNALYPDFWGNRDAFIAKISDNSPSFRAYAVNPQCSESFYGSFFPKPDPAGLASGGSFSTTIAADGESRLLLRFFSNEPVSVTVAVEGADPANGSLSDLNGYLSAGWDDTSVTVFADHPYGEGYVGYAVYRAPRDFTIPGCEDRLTRPASLEINHPGGTETLSLTIRRPPILLSHGLWSSPDVLEDFKNDLWNRFSDTGGKNIDDFIRANDGRVVNAAHFNAGAARTKSNIREYLKDLRQRGSIVTQVDYMGHSMGGIWGRLVKQSYPRDVFTYDKSYINKIITVDTPHLGSFLADLADIIFNAADYQIRGIGNIRDVLCTISFSVDLPMCFGAVEDLTTEGCVDWLEDVYMPSHAVVGNKYIDTACLLLSLSDRIPDASAKAAAKLFKVMEMILKVINPDWGCENWINLLDVPTYTDYVVSLTSQEGGLYGPQVSVFEMRHTECWKNEDVNGEVLDLLNTSVDDPVFAGHLDAAGDLVSLEYLMNLEQLKQKARKKSIRPKGLFSSVDAGIAFVTPSDGEVISPGDTVDVEITTTGGLTLESLLVIDPYSDPVDITSPPYTTSFNVPLDAYGSYSLTALGEGTDGELYGAKVTLDVENPATLVSLEVSPETLFIDTGGAVGISVMGEFTDGSLRDLSKGSAGTTYESGNTGIVTVDANGTCTGISAGTADVTVRHGAQPAVTIAVKVAQPYINAAFKADKYAGPAPLAVDFTDISAGYIDQWQWGFGDGGTSTDRNPSHTYSHDGNYTVTMTVSGPGGSDNDTEVIVVTEALPGDANGDGKTTIDEVQKAINQFLSIVKAEPCNDLDNDGQVTIDEMQKVINAFLGKK
ncbi:MAG: SBBP repeat-containing protein, partial [Deltaproteobacteria bacterium]|nr:SBBP repeat-containing protein [Deltaproteobacteria bacterium]